MVTVNLKEYNAKRRRKLTIVLVILIVAVFALMIFSIAQTRFHTTFLEAWEVIYHRIMNIPPVGYDQIMRDHFVFNEDIPRALCAIFVGASLSVCGAVMQSMTRNPLTDPYTMGLSSAALLGVVIAIALEICIIPGIIGNDAAIVNAFVFTLIPAAVIIFLTTFKKLSSTMMVLTGIGIMYMFTSISTFIRINVEAEKLEEIYRWTVGSMSMVTWDAVLPTLAVMILMVVAFTLLANRINVLALGDRPAQSLGVNPIRMRIVCLLLISVAVATCVSFTGTIGFVGLVCPHITRLITGNNNKVLIPFSALTGALMLLLADTAVRMLPYGLPAGVITAVVGSPLFIYFLYRQRKIENF